MPGFGRADRPRDFEYTVGGYARHLTGLLAKLGVRRAHLVLHDFGGPWGLAWAMANPNALASLTLINTGIMAATTLNQAIKNRSRPRPFTNNLITHYCHEMLRGRISVAALDMRHDAGKLLDEQVALGRGERKTA